MKKVTFLAVAIAVLGMTSMDANAQASTQGNQAATQGQQQATNENKEKITKDELPESVKTVLEHDNYEGWTVGEIYKVKPAEGAQDNKVVYEINLTNAEGQAGTLVLDEAGKAVASR